MASASDIAQVRRNVDEPTTDTYTDQTIGDYVDANGVAGASQLIWQEKAASYATLVNTSEAGASHSFSDLHKNALAMATAFGAAVVVPTADRVRVKKIERT